MRILFFDIDTLRPDHLGCYGYGRDTSPAMDAIAADGVRFTRYYTPNAPCLPSRASLITGQYGIHTGIVGHGGTAADMRPIGPGREFRDERSMGSLFTQLRLGGLHTVSFSSFPERHTAWWFNAGLNEAYNNGGVGHEGAEAVTPGVLDWLERNGSKDDWCLHVHYWDPHGPYRAPASFGNPFESEPLADAWITEDVFAQHLMEVGPHGANEIGMWSDETSPHYPRYPGKLENMAQVKDFIDQYDCGIRYADDNIRMVVDKLRQMGLYEELAIIITSDHGETMGELGIYGEHATADEATCHIPMIIKWPGGRAGAVDDGLRNNTDLLPTLRELLQVEEKAPLFNYMAVPPDDYDGVSYAQSLVGDGAPGRPAVVCSQCAHVCQRSARFEHYIYIRTYHGGYHLFAREMLFDLDNDPHQTIDLAAQRPDLCARGAKIILDWVDEMMETSLYDSDPLWTVMRENGPYHVHGRLPAYLDRLQGTPREEKIPLLRQRYAKDMEDK